MSIKTAVADLIRELPCLENLRRRRQIKNFTCFMLDEAEVIAAEQNDEQKHKLVQRQKQNYPANMRHITPLVKKVIAQLGLDYDKESELICDMEFCFFAYGFSPYEYLCYGLKDKDYKGRRSFMSENESAILGFTLNSMNSIMLLSNKYESYKILAPFYKRQILQIDDACSFEDFNNFIEAHPVFVKKVVDESCGRGVELIDTDTLDSDRHDLYEKYKSLATGVILEELVEQVEPMSRFNQSSVNTLRCMTYKHGDKVDVPFCFMKVGRAGSFVDNGGAGGILVGIDNATGTLVGDGIDELATTYSEHPDSHMVFNGFVLPEFEQMKALCCEAALCVPGASWIGWDVAYGKDGWLIIEGNALPEVIGPQSTSGQGMRDELLSYSK